MEETTVCSYEYDTASQLIRENNKTLEKTYVFVYDVGGNIISKEEYVFTEEDLSELTPTNTVSYSYDSVWKDKLVNFNGEAITYDEMGNPLNYVKQDIIDSSADNGILTWNGRQLESVTIDGITHKYIYDSEGLRTRTERYDSETNAFEGAVNYIWRDGKLSAYSNENPDGVVEQNIKMLFDDTGETIGYTHYNLEENQQTTFYFGKNVFGDIVTVYDDNGEALVTYNYDAWGCVTAKAHGETVEEILAAIVALMFTPITYRGYNYDVSTGLYYLQSRYYNPAYGRFLNADTTDILETTKGTIHGANLFAYCNNNPVMNVDYTGELGVGTAIIILFIVLLCLPELEKLMFGSEFALHKYILNQKFQKAYKQCEGLVRIQDHFLSFGIDIIEQYFVTYLIFATHAKNIVDYGTRVNLNPEYERFNEIAPGLSHLTYKGICSNAYVLATDLDFISNNKTWDSMTAEEQYVFVHEMLFYDQKTYEYLYIFARQKLITWPLEKFADFLVELFDDYNKI